MYIVVGVPGAGKSTVLSEFIKKHGDWEVINYGTLMFDIAKENGITDRDEMRKAPLKVQKKIQEEVARILEKISREGKRILDTHAAIKTPKGYLPGLPEKTLKSIEVEGIILITAKAEDIMARRNKDKTRKRDKEGVYEIKDHILINKIMCSTYAILSAAPLSIIENKENGLDETVNKLEDVLME